MKTRLFALLVFALAPLAPTDAPAARLDRSIKLVVESPGDVISGIGLVAGYALSKKGAIDYVTWSVDGEEKGFVPYGGSRGDVAAAFPGYADSQDPGFATAWNYNLFEPGSHELVVRAYDDQGGYNEAKRTFRTVRFRDEKFLRPEEIALPVLPIARLQLHPDRARADRFDVDLAWSAAAQQYVIREISPVCLSCDKLSYFAPTLDAVTKRPDGRIEISWTGGSAVMAFAIERRMLVLSNEALWQPVGTVAGTNGSFLDSPPAGGPDDLIVVGSLWEYRVRGLGSSNESPWSNVLSVPVL